MGWAYLVSHSSKSFVHAMVGKTPRPSPPSARRKKVPATASTPARHSALSIALQEARSRLAISSNTMCARRIRHWWWIKRRSGRKRRPRTGRPRGGCAGAGGGGGLGGGCWGRAGAAPARGRRESASEQRLSSEKFPFPHVPCETNRTWAPLLSVTSREKQRCFGFGPAPDQYWARHRSR